MLATNARQLGVNAQLILFLEEVERIVRVNDFERLALVIRLISDLTT